MNLLLLPAKYLVRVIEIIFGKMDNSSNTVNAMKNPFFQLTVLIFIPCIVLLYGCGRGGGPPKATLRSISVTPATPSIVKGTTLKLTATATYSNGTSQDVTASVIWSSSATTVAAVKANGLITGIDVGTAKITATSGAISGNISLTVSAGTLRSITVRPRVLSIIKGLTLQLKAIGKYSDGTSQDITSSVIWSSSATTVVTANASGLITGVGVGTARVTATSGTKSGSISFKVREATLQSITVKPNILSIIEGLSLELKAIGAYSDGTSQDITSSVLWSSGATTVATINASGLTAGVGVGATMITATSGTISGSISLTVRSATFQSITVRPMLPSVIKGMTLQLKAIGTYSDGTSQDVTSSVIWSSGASTVATVNASGLATAVHIGRAKITAILGIISGSTLLTVAPPTLQSITVASVTPSRDKSVTQQLTATAFYSDGTSQDITSSVIWSSSAPAVVAVDESGLATGVNIGKVKIFATSGSISGSTSLTVRTRRAGRQWVLQTLWQ